METLWHIREAALKLTVLTLSIRTFPQSIIEFIYISDTSENLHRHTTIKAYTFATKSYIYKNWWELLKLVGQILHIV